MNTPASATAYRTVTAPAKSPRIIWLNRHESAEYINVTFNTLTFWASVGKGPAYYPHGKRAMYRLEDLDAWLATQRVSFEQVPA